MLRTDRSHRQRRLVLGGVGAVGLSAGAALLYRAAPGFWQQFANERRRVVHAAPHRPDWKSWPQRGLHAAWLGHSTVLLSVDGFTILTDPVFSDYAGVHLGLTSVGVKRLVAPALAIDDLPPIDLILVSHAHMDHLDRPSLRALASPRTKVVMARRTSDLLRPWWYRDVREIGWGEETQVGPARVRAIEVNHWGARVRTDNYRGYNGYVIESGRTRVLFGGDTAVTNAFRQVRTARAVDLAIMPIGAYDPWLMYHCNPEQAWQMATDAGAEVVLPVHHRTFVLSREPVGEPLERLRQAAGGPARVALGEIGEEYHLVL